MDDRTDFDFEGPGGTAEGIGLDSTANTAGVLADDIGGALSAIERGEADGAESVADPRFAALARSLRERPEIARYLASRVHKRRSGDPPEDVDELLAALVGLGLEEVAPQFADVLDEEYGTTEE